MTFSRATDLLQTGTHASRPAANAVATGTLYSCSTHKLVYKSDGSSWSTWADVTGSASSTLTTKGDLLTFDGTALARLPVGSNGQVLTADSTQTDGIKWATPSGSGGTPYALDPTTLHATYGDHFTGSSLDAKWTRAGSYVVGDESYQKGGGTWLQTAFRASGSYYYQTAPPGDFALVMKATVFNVTASTMFGLLILDSSGNGVGGGWYNNNPDSSLVGLISAGTYSSGAVATGGSAPKGSLINQGGLTWYKLVKSGTSYTLYVSINGYTWSPAATLTSSFTPARIGFGTFFGGALGAGGLSVDFFDVQ